LKHLAQTISSSTKTDQFSEEYSFLFFQSLIMLLVVVIIFRFLSSDSYVKKSNKSEEIAIK